jgi:hypothetical protein
LFAPQATAKGTRRTPPTTKSAPFPPRAGGNRRLASRRLENFAFIESLADGDSRIHPLHSLAYRHNNQQELRARAHTNQTASCVVGVVAPGPRKMADSSGRPMAATNRRLGVVAQQLAPTGEWCEMVTGSKPWARARVGREKREREDQVSEGGTLLSPKISKRQNAFRSLTKPNRHHHTNNHSPTLETNPP